MVVPRRNRRGAARSLGVLLGRPRRVLRHPAGASLTLDARRAAGPLRLGLNLRCRPADILGMRMTALARTPRQTGRVALLLASAVTFTALAGVLHLVAGMQHLSGATLLGCGLLATGLAQLVAGVLLHLRPSTGLAQALLLGTLLALAIFALQHTVGLPGLEHAEAGDAIHYHASGRAHDHGAAASEVWEPVALATIAAQVALVVALLPLLRRKALPARRLPSEPV